MNNKSMTESELKEFLTALSDNCGNKKKMEWYHGLIDDIGIAFTSNNTPSANETINEAKRLYQNGNKLEAVKLMCQSGYRLKDAKNYCDENFGLLPNLPNSTENLSKIKDKDKWLNEVRGNEGLSEMQKAWIAAGLNPEHYSAACADAMKIYSDSKLSELEKWIDEVIEEQHYHIAIAAFNEVKDKIQTLK